MTREFIRRGTGDEAIGILFRGQPVRGVLFFFGFARSGLPGYWAAFWAFENAGQACEFWQTKRLGRRLSGSQSGGT